MRGAAESQELVYCNSIGKYIHIRVVECDAYRNVCQPTLDDMKQTAFILETKGKNIVGFTSARKWRNTHPDEEIIRGDDAAV